MGFEAVEALIAEIQLMIRLNELKGIDVALAWLGPGKADAPEAEESAVRNIIGVGLCS